MDHSCLLNSKPRELALYLRQVASALSSQAVTKEILTRIEDQSISPSVFNIWCTASGDPRVVKDGLDQHFSRLVCRAAIKRFGKLMQTSQPDSVWNTVGGTSGILGFLSRTSVSHVRLFCNELGRSGAKAAGKQRRQELVDQLVQCLLLQGSLEMQAQTDLRPLQRYYRAILPACSSQVRKAIGDGDDILHAPISARRERLLRAVAETGEFIGGIDNIMALLNDNGSEPKAPRDERMSTNMLFAVELLEVLAQTDKPIKGVSHEVLYNSLILPFFRQHSRRKTRPDHVAAAVHFFTKYHQKHDQETKPTLDMSRRSIIWCIVHRWTRHPDQLDESLRNLLELFPLSHSSGTASDIVGLVCLAPPLLRFRLLRLLLRYIEVFSADITSDDELSSLPFQWPSELFLALPRDSGKLLLERVIALRTTKHFSYWTSGAAALQKQHRGDPTCLLLMLSSQDSSGLATARAAIEERRGHAVRARPQPERAFWAQSAIDCSVASGSLDLCRDTMLWAKRFRKDPLTVKAIYSNVSVSTDEGIDLLRGFPTRPQSNFTSLEVISQHIHTANQICLDLIQEACEALKEPGFHLSTWRSSLSLFGRIIASRIHGAPLLQLKLKLSDEDVYETIFRDTLVFALELERLRLEDANSPLYPAPSGALPCTTNRAALKFADELARCRNELWETYRWRDNPATLELSAAYPRGLPLQYLCFDEMDTKIPGYTEEGYMQARAAKVVFIDPSLALEALPEEQDLQEAIGFFVDDWIFALQTHVSFSADPGESALSAWKHAIGPLSETRMSPFEAFSFWSIRFKRALKKLDIYGPWDQDVLAEIPDPRVPHAENGHVTEWHPDSEASSYGFKPRKMKPTNLDAMLGADFTVGDARTKWKDVEAPLTSAVPQSLWERYQGHRQVEPSTREALICSTLAYLSEEITTASGVFSKPFPPFTHGRGLERYPALYLDDEFLKQQRGQCDAALRLLMRFSDHVPPTLLQQLVTAAFDQHSETNNGPPPTAFELLKLLAESDRPQLALGMLQHVVMDLHSYSSWLRKLFSPGTLKSLPADTARAFVNEMSSNIQRRLAEASAAKATEDNTQEKPFIKVTTVKMLAQLLAGAEFIDEKSTTNVLTALLTTSMHHDSRVTAVEAMLQILIDTKDLDIRKNIINSLKRHTVPMMSNINERHPASEESQGSEARPEQLPEVSIDIGNLPPMLSAVLNVANTNSVEDQVRRELFDSVLLPTLLRSIKENAQWMKRFFRHMNLPTVSLPRSPVHPLLVGELLRSPEFAPAYLLDLWLGIFVPCEFPSAELKAVRKKIEGDKIAAHAAARRYWNQFWMAAKISLQRIRPVLLLKRDFTSQVPDGIDHVKLQDAWLEQANTILRKADTNLIHRNIILQDLGPPMHSPVSQRPKELACWRQYIRPLVQHLVEQVDAIRTPAWQRDPNRVPNLVPDVITARRWLLLFPEERPASPVEHTFSAVLTLLDELSTSSRLYANQFHDLINQTLNIHQDASERISLALQLGCIVTEKEEQEELDTTDYLRVDFAVELLNSAGVSSHEEKENISSLLRCWIGHVDEDVRVAGMKCVQKLKASGMGGAAMFEGDEWVF